MAALTEGSFELDGFRFGGDSDSFVCPPGGFDPGAKGWRTQDQDSPVGDHTNFGRDLLSPPTWAWSLTSNMDTLEEALEAVEEVESKWLGLSVRDRPSAVMELRYRLAGRDRMVYGRPRRFSHDLTPLAWQGVVNAVCDFARVDTLHYDDVVRTADLSILPGSSSGLTSPLVGSLSTVSGGEQASAVGGVGGTAPTPITVLINGPITNPYIEGEGWRLTLNTTLEYDQSVLIDTRPFANTVTRNDGVSLAGALTRTSLLSKARLKPGSTVLRFGGKDVTGTATASVKWRPAYYSL